MFQVRLQTYWADSDAAGIVYFPNFFKFAEHAEEEMFRASGEELQPLLRASHVWLASLPSQGGATEPRTLSPTTREMPRFQSSR